MKPINPVYKRLLLIAIIIWIISMTFYVSNLYFKVGEMEHALIHK